LRSSRSGGRAVWVVPGNAAAAERLPELAHGRFGCDALYARRREESVVFTVKGIDPSGRTMTFACGTDEQAMEKTWELARRGFREIRVADPRGKEMSAAAFERSLNIDWD
jgi:hypothetical protein